MKLLKLGSLENGTSVNNIRVSDVKINYLGDNFLHTATAGDPSKPNLVMLHGYCGSAATYYRLLPPLAEHYYVNCVDLLGTGLSSRPKFEVSRTDDVVDFFVESLEKWRQAQKLESIHLVGHSLGGYLAAKYSLKYPRKVVRLSLISPAGVTKHDDDSATTQFYEWGKKLTWRNGLSKLFFEFWNQKMTPQSLHKSLGFAGNLVMGNIIASRMRRPKAENELLYGYFSNWLRIPESSDIALHYLLKPPSLAAYQPLEEEFKRLEIPVEFYYGSNDWMDSTGARRVAETNPFKYKLAKIPNAGHLVIVDNPKGLVQHLVK